MAAAEGKNDNVNSGLGQCIAEMRAAWLFNVAKNEHVPQVFGHRRRGRTGNSCGSPTRK
jgi:hypothetical protein